MVLFILVGSFFCFSHKQSIILSAGEEIDEVARRAIGMGMDRIGEVGGRTSEGQVFVV